MENATQESIPPEPDNESTAESEQAPKDSPVSLRTKLLYGLPAVAGAAMAIPIGVHMPRFYSDEILAPLGFIAVVVAVARAFDAITDPAMEWISDHTRTRWGRRLPWIAIPRFVATPSVSIPLAVLCVVGYVPNQP